MLSAPKGLVREFFERRTAKIFGPRTLPAWADNRTPDIHPSPMSSALASAPQNVFAADLPTVLLLAAGRSERFRAASGGQDKLEAALHGHRVRDWTLAAVKASGLPWHVVERGDTAHMELPGMGDSIATGVAATRQAPGWLVLPADLPLIQAITLLQVAKALQTHTVVVPTWQGERGHPVGFAAACMEALLALHGDHGARAVVNKYGAHLLPVQDAGCVHDVDTPQALEEARQAIEEARQRLG